MATTMAQVASVAELPTSLAGRALARPASAGVSTTPAGLQTFHEVLDERARAAPDATAFAFHDDAAATRLTYGELRAAAAGVAADELSGGQGDLEDGGAAELAYLQYTSRSTADPRGVALSHRTLLVNSELFARAWATPRTAGRSPGCRPTTTSGCPNVPIW